MICVGANKALNGDENILTKAGFLIEAPRALSTRMTSRSFQLPALMLQEAERKRNAAKITFAITRVKRQHWPKVQERVKLLISDLNALFVPDLSFGLQGPSNLGQCQGDKPAP